MSKRAISDIGGLSGGPVDRSEHTPTMTERRIDAMMILLRAKPRSFWATDEHGNTIERRSTRKNMRKNGNHGLSNG